MLFWHFLYIYTLCLTYQKGKKKKKIIAKTRQVLGKEKKDEKMKGGNINIAGQFLLKRFDFELLSTATILFIYLCCTFGINFCMLSIIL